MMLGLTPLILTPGPKGFFENAEYLIGIPLVALGILGVLLVLSPIELRWPQRQAAAEAHVAPGAEGHPRPAAYITVGLILAGVTLVEVAIYYVDMAQGALMGILLVLSAMKFLLVVLWFMHLRFDSRIFSILFAGGLVLVMSLFVVVLTSLGASLI